MAFLLAGLSFLAAVQACTVTPVAVPSGCTNLPSYDSSTGIAGPWIVEVNQCVNTTATDNACNIEGFGSEAVYFLQQGDTSVVRGYIGIVSRNDLAKSPLRCNDATDAFESYVPSGVSGAEWKAVNVTDIPYSAQLMWGLGQYSLPIQAYYHYLDGVKQDGIFLGAHNVTSWAVQLQDGSAGSGGQPYWLIRLLGPGSEDPVTGAELEEGEYKTFIRIDGS
ncbi:hypothetical protein N7523_001785 [Penicillium sp. IBT 18751x]|nr:hypothetical protein N7523_001785 [Penicillium sp. IBT 18751x]